jgi:hypothetical protein
MRPDHSLLIDIPVIFLCFTEFIYSLSLCCLQPNDLLYQLNRQWLIMRKMQGVFCALCPIKEYLVFNFSQAIHRIEANVLFVGCKIQMVLPYRKRRHIVPDAFLCTGKHLKE